jgi:hypothetical protein
MRKHDAYPSKYLKADDLSPGLTRATVGYVAHEPMMDGRPKPVAFFEGFSKGCVVNATNANVLYALAGTDDDADWPGLVVELYTELVRNPSSGKTGPVIRFRPPQAKARKRADHPSNYTETDPPPNLGEHLDDEVSPLFDEVQ